MSEQFRRVQPTIPVPTLDPASLRTTAVATKQLVELIAGQSGTPGDAAVTFNDLVRLGLIQPERVPKQLG